MWLLSISDRGWDTDFAARRRAFNHCFPDPRRPQAEGITSSVESVPGKMGAAEPMASIAIQIELPQIGLESRHVF
jgi:hypothetical protein